MRVLTLRRAGQEINVSKWDNRTDLDTRLLFDVSHKPEGAGETEVFCSNDRSIHVARRFCMAASAATSRRTTTRGSSLMSKKGN